METRVCIKCGKEFPLTVEYFYIAKASKSGFHGDCKKCTAEYKRQYAQDNKEYLAKKMKQYYIDNKEKHDINGKIYYKEHEEYRKRHNAVAKKYQAGNKEKFTAYQKRYRMEHSEEYRIHCQMRRVKISKLPSTLTAEQWEGVKEHFNHKCAYCGKELSLAQEHFVPLSEGGEYALGNILPSCKSCNSSKNNKNFFKWYPGYMDYSVKREKAILAFLNYDGNKQQLAFAL